MQELLEDTEQIIRQLETDQGRSSFPALYWILKLTQYDSSCLLIIMEGQLWFGPLNKEHFGEMQHLIVEANRHANPLLAKKLQTIQQFRKETLQMIHEYYELQEKENALSGRNGRRFYGARLNGELVGVVLSVDAIQRYQYSKKIANDENHPARKRLAVFASLGLDDLKPGVASYHARICVLPGLSKKGIASRLHYEFCKYELSQGYQFSFQITLLDESSRILERFGSEEVRNQEFVEPNSVLRLRIFKTDLKKVVQTYEMTLLAKL